MTIRHRVVITCADEVSAQTRARIETALASLEIETAPAEANDDLAEAGLVPLYIADATTERLEAPDHPRAVRLLITDSAEPAPKGWLTLRADEIATTSRPWLNALRALGQSLERPGLVAHAATAGDHDQLTDWAQRFPLDPLAAPIRALQSPAHLRSELEAAIARAQQAEQTALERDAARKRAEHDAQLSRKQAVAGRNAFQRMSLQNEVLRMHLEEGAWSPDALRGEKRQLVESARQSVWRARAAAAAADRAEEAGVDHRIWPEQGAEYTGHTTDRRPHGVGVMRFGDNQDAVFYRGDFEFGLRHGYGIGADENGRVWIGEWQNDQPHGFGALELPDGARWEGKVAPQTETEPAYCNLHVWSPRSSGAEAKQVFTETRLRIEAPPAETPPAN